MLPKLFVNGFSYLKGDSVLEDFSSFMDVRKLRRAEPISRNALLCSFRALEKAQIKQISSANLGISLAMGAGALGSTLKFMDSIIEDGDELSSPTAFASSVHNSTALSLSMFLGIHGPCVVTGQLDASFGAALLTAQQFLAKQMCQQVLVAVTEDINPLLTDRLQKDEQTLAPFVYQPHLTASRLAGAFVVSAQATPATEFVLDKIILSNTGEYQTQSQPLLPIQSCAHSMLLLATYLQQGKPFSLKEQFAGTLLEMEGRPYVFS